MKKVGKSLKTALLWASMNRVTDRINQKTTKTNRKKQPQKPVTWGVVEELTPKKVFFSKAQKYNRITQTSKTFTKMVSKTQQPFNSLKKSSQTNQLNPLRLLFSTFPHPHSLESLHRLQLRRLPGAEETFGKAEERPPDGGVLLVCLGVFYCLALLR